MIKRRVGVMVPASIPIHSNIPQSELSFLVLAPTSVNVSNNSNFSHKSIDIKQRKIDIYGV